MSTNPGSGNADKLLNQAISGFISITHVIAFFQIVICSRHMAVAFDIPAKNIGIYFAKLYSLRSLLMSMGCGVEYVIFRATSSMDVRKYLSMAWFCLLTICEVSFLLVLYFSKNVAYHNYIVLNLEGLFGFFQMSILSLIPDFAAYYMLSLYVSGTCIFIIQTVIDKCTKNSMLSVKIQSWICVICSVACVPSWIYYLIQMYEDPTQQTSQTKNGSTSQPCVSAQSQAPASSSLSGSGSGNGAGGGGGGSSGSAAQSPSVSSSSTGAESPAPGGGSGSPGSLPGTPGPVQSKMEYVMSLTSVTILKIMTTKLDELCKSLSSDTLINVQMLITRLQQIRVEREITYDVLVAIDLVILGLKKCSCSEDNLFLLAELSLFLRIKVLVKTEPSKPIQVSSPYSHTHLPVETLLYTYPGYGYRNGYLGNEGTIRAKRSTGEVDSPRGRKRREVQQQQSQTPGTQKNFLQHLLASLSPLMMFGTGSLVKDFLFPGVIPYGLLERDKCHLINLIVIIFLSIGPLTIFLINYHSSMLKKKVEPYHYFWTFMVPKIVILIISLCAIHTKQGCTHKIRSSQGIVLFMTVVLLTCYGFLETLSFVGMAFYVKVISCDPSGTVDLQAIQNVSGKFFRYLVYKVSVGYNKTRIGAGFVLPNFKPPEPISNTFGFWFCGTFSNGWKDIKGDFKMGIQQYLAVSQTVSKKSPLETLRYCDLLM